MYTSDLHSDMILTKIKKKKLNFRYLPSAVFLAIRLVGPSKCLKQIIQMKVNRAKNPNWPETNQLSIYKHGRGFELGTTENKSTQRCQRSGRDLKSGPPNYKSSRALTAQPCCLLDKEKRQSLREKRQSKIHVSPESLIVL